MTAVLIYPRAFLQSPGGITSAFRITDREQMVIAAVREGATAVLFPECGKMLVVRPDPYGWAVEAHTKEGVSSVLVKSAEDAIHVIWLLHNKEGP